MFGNPQRPPILALCIYFQALKLCGWKLYGLSTPTKEVAPPGLALSNMHLDSEAPLRQNREPPAKEDGRPGSPEGSSRIWVSGYVPKNGRENAGTNPQGPRKPKPQALPGEDTVDAKPEVWRTPKPYTNLLQILLMRFRV